MPKLVPLIVVGATLLSSVGAAGSYALMNDVTVSVDGTSTTSKVTYATVGEVLRHNGVTVGTHDVVEPSLTTAISDDTVIEVTHARPVLVTLDGVLHGQRLAVRTVADVLDALGIDAEGAVVSQPLDASIPLSGAAFTVHTPKDVTVTAGGATQELRATGTVADALAEVGITPDDDDLTTPALDENLSDGLGITFVKVDTSVVTRDVAIPFAEKTTKDSNLAAGTKKVQVAGVNGLASETVRQVLHDDAVVSEEQLSWTVQSEPVQQETVVGTKTVLGASSTASPATGNQCQASHYGNGDGTDGGPTASGETFNASGMTAAHKTLALGTKIKVTNVANGKTVIVRINDRGPYVGGRCLDLSYGAFSAIGSPSSGVMTVAWETV